MTSPSWVRALSRVLGTTVLAVLIAFLCSEAAPGSIAERAASVSGFAPAVDNTMTDATREALRREVASELGVAGTGWQRLGSVVRGLPTLEFGQSWKYRVSARSLLGGTVGKSLGLVATALALAFALGLWSATKSRTAHRATRRLIALASSTLMSIPPVWLGILAIAVFAGGAPLRIFPTGGASLLGYVLPVAVLAALPWAYVHQHASSLFDELGAKAWARAALARGASPSYLYRVHILRAALPRLLPTSVGLCGYLLGASAVIEVLFGLGGLGPLLINVALAGDVPVLLTLTAVYALTVSLVSVASDALRRHIDPRLGGIDA